MAYSSTTLKMSKTPLQTGMSVKHKDILRLTRKALKETIIVEGHVLDYLYQEKVITVDQMNEIINLPSRGKQVSALLDLLPMRGPRAFDTFLQAIEADYDWIHEYLEKQSNAVEDSAAEYDEIYYGDVAENDEDAYPGYDFKPHVPILPRLPPRVTMMQNIKTNNNPNDVYKEYKTPSDVEGKHNIYLNPPMEAEKVLSTVRVAQDCWVREINYASQLTEYKTICALQGDAEPEFMKCITSEMYEEDIVMDHVSEPSTFTEINKEIPEQSLSRRGQTPPLPLVPLLPAIPKPRVAPRQSPSLDVIDSGKSLTNSQTSEYGGSDSSTIVACSDDPVCTNNDITHNAGLNSETPENDGSGSITLGASCDEPVCANTNMNHSVELNADLNSAQSNKYTPVLDSSLEQEGAHLKLIENSASQKPQLVKLNKGDLLFLTNHQSPHTSIVHALDIYSRLLLVPAKNLRIHGDPSSERWFYPVAITSKQAALMLCQADKPGCFIVYKPINCGMSEYNISQYRHSGKVTTYHVLKDTVTAELHFEEERTFDTIQDLVRYYSYNRGTMRHRLRFPLSDICKPRILGDIFEEKFIIDYSLLEFQKGNCSKLGKGNFGNVQIAKINEKVFAVKQKNSEEDSIAFYDDDFYEEGRICSKLNHSNIVILLGVSKSSDCIMLLFEHCPGGDLRQALRNSKISLEDIQVPVNLCMQVLSALTYLHRVQHIIHRDIAARNCLLNGAMDTIKLADFGLARFVIDDEYHAEKVEKFAVRWAPPEVLSDLRFSSWSDIWSAGVLFWEIFSSGLTPYNEIDRATMKQAIISGEHSLKRPDSCPETIFLEIRKCWNREPRDRPRAEVLRDVINTATFYSRTGPGLPVGEGRRSGFADSPTCNGDASYTMPTTKLPSVYNLSAVFRKKKLDRTSKIK